MFKVTPLRLEIFKSPFTDSYKKGDDVKSIILSIDSERERVSLGIKQLEQEQD